MGKNCTLNLQCLKKVDKNRKNVLCEVVDRHPHDNLEIFNSFLDYMESLTAKISTENKDI